MVYSDPDNNIDFSALSTTTPRVIIAYKNTDIHTITGPVPFIKISESPNTSENGELFSSKLSITLDGKIFCTGSGVSGIINKITSLKDLFYGSGAGSVSNYNDVLKIKCDGGIRFEVSGLKILNFAASQTPDNWTSSANYSIDLEAYIPRISGLYGIKSASEDWTIEPLDDYAYYENTTISTSGRLEYHNPIIGNATPSPNQGGPISLSLVNIPRYKISRKLSAVGFSTGISVDSAFSAHQLASNWVHSRIKLSHESENTSSPRINFSYLNGKTSDQYYLYNHLRNTSFSVDAGSYEINDTWLALPTGISYVEDYTVDCSTDIRNVKTVRVQGTIKGLTLANKELEESTNTNYIIPTSGTNEVSPFSGMMALPRTLNTTANQPAPKLLDNFGVDSTHKDLNQHKYINALSGWIADIKPYLYRRACIVVNSTERNVGNYPYNTLDTSPTILRPNPIFSNERLLNINPVSCTEDHDPRKGTIGYNYEFSNKLTYLSGVLSESIRINDNGPADVINESFVLGRRLGPQLQNLGSRTSSRKDLSIEISVVPPSDIAGFVLNNKACPVYSGGAVFSGVSGLINDFKPFSTTRLNGVFGGAGSVTTSGTAYVASDTTIWDPIQGRYTRNVSWIYQHCKLVYNNLDS
jgi:hypothetical protein